MLDEDGVEIVETPPDEDQLPPKEDEDKTLDDGGDMPPEESPPVKPKKSVQERIDELTFKFRQAERDSEHWKAIAAAKTVEDPKSLSAKQASVSGRPTPGGYETVEEYEDALYGWFDNKRVQATAENKIMETRRKALDTFNDNAKELREKHEDFEAAINAPVFTDAMRSTIFSIDNGPMVAYHLGKNPVVAEKMKALSPERQMYEISKLENKLLLAQKGKAVSTTPDPIKPVGDAGGVATDPDKMTTAQWMKWDNEKRLAKIKKRFGQA